MPLGEHYSEDGGGASLPCVSAGAALAPVPSKPDSSLQGLWAPAAKGLFGFVLKAMPG